MAKVHPHVHRNPAFTSDETLAPGTRVRLVGTPIAVTLRSNLGIIVSPDQWTGFVIVRLDEPALYHCADGTVEELPEIREGIDNLEVLSA